MPSARSHARAVGRHVIGEDRGWGLLSVGTGAPIVIVLTEEREPVERLSRFELALLRTVENIGDYAADDVRICRWSSSALSWSGSCCLH